MKINFNIKTGINSVYKILDFFKSKPYKLPLVIIDKNLKKIQNILKILLIN